MLTSEEVWRACKYNVEYSNALYRIQSMWNEFKNYNNFKMFEEKYFSEIERSIRYYFGSLDAEIIAVTKRPFGVKFKCANNEKIHIHFTIKRDGCFRIGYTLRR